MSTILDALRKAQDETGNERRARVEAMPPGDPGAPHERRPRRTVVWLGAAVAVAVVAFIGTLALGDRLSGMFGGDDAPAPQEGAQQASLPPPAEVADVKTGLPTEGHIPGEPAAKAHVPQQEERVAAARPRRERDRQREVASARQQQPDAVPTPAGQLHVFGGGGKPNDDESNNEDRAARLQQLRERMLKARQEAAGRAETRANKPPVPIIVPPPHDAAAPAQANAPANGVQPAPSDAAIARAREAASATSDAQALAAVTAAAQRDAGTQVAAVPPPPPPAVASRERVEVPSPERADAPVGVSVTAGHQEHVGETVDEPEVAAAQVEVPAEAPASAPVQATAEAPTTVAALPPQAAAAPAQPPVLRRSPGGAPQVSINILQWSTEPDRRFAFVSVDGGGMTQVREGDRIGGLTVKHIHQQMIEFGFNESTFLLRAN